MRSIFPPCVGSSTIQRCGKIFWSSVLFGAPPKSRKILPGSSVEMDVLLVNGKVREPGIRFYGAMLSAGAYFQRQERPDRSAYRRIGVRCTFYLKKMKNHEKLQKTNKLILNRNFFIFNILTYVQVIFVCVLCDQNIYEFSEYAPKIQLEII